MADGYARSCGEPGVAMVTKGPGRCNVMTAIVNAFTDCVSLVVIGHSSRKQLAKGMLQDLIGPAEEVNDPFLPNTTNIPMEPGMTVNLEASSHEVVGAPYKWNIHWQLPKVAMNI
jgi:Thiamine pyrophosphate enzyme, N-terminal TPP binding domain